MTLFVSLTVGCNAESDEDSCPDVGASCGASIKYVAANFSAVEVYKDGTLVLTEAIDTDQVYESCGKLVIAFDSNSEELNSILLSRNSGGLFCEIATDIGTGDSHERVVGEISGDSLDTFTEIRAGNHRFVPVR